MADYIEKEAAKEAILSWAVCINHPELLSKEDAMYCIDNLPAADVAPVRHGRWEPPAVGKYGVLCSVCRSQVDNPFAVSYTHLVWKTRTAAYIRKETGNEKTAPQLL